MYRDASASRSNTYASTLLALNLTLVIGCGRASIPETVAVSRPGRVGYGIQTHSARLTTIVGVSVAGDSPDRGSTAEGVWRADRGGTRLLFCTSSSNGNACQEAVSDDRMRGPFLIVDPINLGRFVATGATSGIVDIVASTDSSTETEGTFPAPPLHGVWITSPKERGLFHCHAGDLGPRCHRVMFENRNVSPQPVLAIFLLGDSQVIWLHDASSRFQTLRCHVHPERPVPTCLAAQVR